MNEKTITVKGFLKKLIGFSTASWLSAGISFLTTPFFTRLYAPEQTGRINMFIAFMNFFQTFSVFALDQAFMRFYNEDIDGLCKNNLLRYCLRINLFISCISAIFIFSAHSYIAKQIAGENIWLIPVCLVIVMTCGTFLRMSSVSSRMEGNIIQYSLQIVLISFVEKIVCTITALYKWLLYRLHWDLSVLVFCFLRYNGKKCSFRFPAFHVKQRKLF